MTIRISLDLDGLTFGQLYRFVDHARSAGVGDDISVAIESTDALGNEIGAHTLTTDLGEVDELTRPVFIARADVPRYANAVARELAQESDQADLQVLRELLDDLWASDQ